MRVFAVLGRAGAQPGPDKPGYMVMEHLGESILGFMRGRSVHCCASSSWSVDSHETDSSHSDSDEDGGDDKYSDDKPAGFASTGATSVSLDKSVQQLARQLGCKSLQSYDYCCQLTSARPVKSCP